MPRNWLDYDWRFEYLNYTKQPNETLIEYQVRLYKNKDAYGLSNIDIGNLLNNASDICKDESAWRKYTMAYMDGYDDCLEKNASLDDELQSLRTAREELYKAKVKVQDANREYRSSLRNDARFENLVDAIHSSVDKLNALKPLDIKAFQGQHLQDKVGVLMLSDWHYGDHINDFTNNFDREICQERLSMLLQETKEICKKESFSKLQILNLGDLVSGNIHVSTRVNNELDIITQVQEVSELIADFISQLSRSVPVIEFYSVTDNHARTNSSKPDHIESENFSRIIHWYLDARFKNAVNIKILNNKINGVEDMEIGMIDIMGQKALFTHGHNDKLSTIVPDLTLLIKEFPIAVFTGHLHRNFEDEINEVDLIMSPSLIGVNKYAKSIRKSSLPRQKLVVFKKQNNVVKRDCTYLIDLR